MPKFETIICDFLNLNKAKKVELSVQSAIPTILELIYPIVENINDGLFCIKSMKSNKCRNYVVLKPDTILKILPDITDTLHIELHNGDFIDIKILK